MVRHSGLTRTHGLLAALLLTATACAPVFSDARLVGTGRAEITPALSATGLTEGGDSHHLANNFSVHAMYGVHDRADLFLGYARTELEIGDAGTNVIEFGPKLGIVRDRLAFALPVGLAFGGGMDTNDTWHFYPTALFTQPLGAHVDLNPAARVLIPTCDDCDVLFGVNLGVGIRIGGERTIMRPEFGFLFDPDEDGFIWHFGFAVSIRPGR
jgi:hypothetical protein